MLIILILILNMVFHKDLYYVLVSIQGSFLFNIDICDVLLWDYESDIASYSDNSTPYTSDISLHLVLEKLEGLTHDFFGMV